MTSILVSREGPLATVTLNRPERLNALDLEMLGELQGALESLRGDPGVRGVILTGAGERAFAAGADIAGFRDRSPLWGQEFARRGQETARAIETLPQPTLAAINGHALGGGLELALACDLRLSVPRAKLGLPEVNLGLMPGWGGTQRLPRLVGSGRAREMILTGEPIGGDEAHRIGLVNRLVEPPGLMKAARETLVKIAEKSPLSLRLAKEAIREGYRPAQESGLALERELFAMLFSTQDAREGVSAFLEKRPPKFQGK
ncbi:MAG: enoyl-CoA hydratase/isomerase family protein [Euryarchaeota archaeon]|nr:enoyl-CoA hydratase/isomerase family protein [Euryarchaeota archaeon]